MDSLGYSISTRAELKEVAPSVFENTGADFLTNRYSHVSTISLIEEMEKMGWQITHAKQNGKKQHARHVIRFENPSLETINVNGDEIKPQTVLDNSHNGSSPAQLWLGLFRIICGNGLIIGIPGMFTHYKFRHVGIDNNEIKEALTEIAKTYGKIAPHIKKMQTIKLEKVQQTEFAIKALAIREPHRFVNKDGSLNKKAVLKTTNPETILVPLRDEDKDPSLWNTFNIIQEKMIKGGYQRKTDKGRKSTTKGMTNATRSITYNKQLWNIAEEYLLPVVVKAEGYKKDKNGKWRNSKGCFAPKEMLDELR